MNLGYPATLKFEYRSRGVVKTTVPVNLRKELQNIAEVVYLEHIVTTLGVQMSVNVSLGAFEWESEISCFFATRKTQKKSRKRCPKRPRGR